jgi:phosphoglycerate dehydrogenase-like enzyme
LLKPTACLMNVALGGFMDEAALIATLEAERIASAGLNITAGAPLPVAPKFWTLPNVVLKPAYDGRDPQR